MIRRLLPTAMLIVLIVVATMPRTVRAEDDFSSIIDSMSAEPFDASPADLFSENDANAVTGRVNEARSFGTPFAVRVVELPTDEGPLRSYNNLNLDRPLTQAEVEEMADAWLRQRPVESTNGARDGILLLIVVPENRENAAAAFAWGENALPQAGITETNMQTVLDDHVMPQLVNGNFVMAAWNGAGQFSYFNLFGRTDRLELSELHQDLQLVAGIPVAALTALSGAFVLGLIGWITGRKRPQAESSSTVASPYAAAALHKGRVSDDVITGALLTLSRQGALQRAPGDDRLIVHPEVALNDPVADRARSILLRQTDSNGALKPSAQRRLQDVMLPVKHKLEDELATQGYFNREAKSETVWVTLAIALSAALVLFTLPPAVLGMARFAIFAITFAVITWAVAAMWISRRTWTTSSGEEALTSWLEAASIGDRHIYDTIVRQDALISSQGGPYVDDTVRFVRTLRGLGAT